jgi:hypothetical protein
MEYIEMSDDERDTFTDELIRNELSYDYAGIQRIFKFLLYVLQNIELNRPYNKIYIKYQENEKIIFIGDIHGSFENLYLILTNEGEDASNHFLNLDNYYIITGDFIDRVGYSVETALLIFHLMLYNNNKFFVLRGNHEEQLLSRHKVSKMIKNHTNLFGELLYKVMFNIYKLEYSRITKNENLFDILHQRIIKNVIKNITLTKPQLTKHFNLVFYKEGLNKIANLFKNIIKRLPYIIILHYRYKGVIKKFFLVHGGIALAEKHEKYISTDPERRKPPKKNHIVYLDFRLTAIFDKLKRNFDKINSLKTLYFHESKIYEDLNMFEMIDNNTKKTTLHKEYNKLKQQLKSFDKIMESEASGYYRALRQSMEREDLSQTMNIISGLLWSDILSKKYKDGIKLSKRKQPKNQSIKNLMKLFNSGIIQTRPNLFSFGPSITEEFTKNNDIDYIIRGHQFRSTEYKTQQNNYYYYGYRFHEEHQNKVITIHSSSQYSKSPKWYGSYIRISGYILEIITFKKKITFLTTQHKNPQLNLLTGRINYNEPHLIGIPVLKKFIYKMTNIKLNNFHPIIDLLYDKLKDDYKRYALFVGYHQNEVYKNTNNLKSSCESIMRCIKAIIKNEETPEITTTIENYIELLIKG